MLIHAEECDVFKMLAVDTCSRASKVILIPDKHPPKSWWKRSPCTYQVIWKFVRM